MPPLEPSSILVVDDEPTQRFVTQRVLHRAGYRVVAAEDGTEALEIALQTPPALVISDVLMPRMDGLQLCRALRAHPKLQTLPLLLMSSLRRDDESVVEGLLAGADDYVELPCEPVRLVAKVSRLLERRRAEEDRLQAEARRWQSRKAEALARLAGGVAHDFNNLLTVINGYCDLALRTLHATDPLGEPLHSIRAAGQHAAALTEKLLALGGERLLHPQVLDLNELLARLQPTLQRLAGDRIELQLHLKPGIGRLNIDPGQLEQFVLDLVLHAGLMMPAGGRVRLQTAEVELDAGSAREHVVPGAGRYVLLRVTDSGPALDESARLRLFDPAFTSWSGEVQLDLGLATGQAFVRDSGGGIEVDSLPGLGTTFHVYLPCPSRAPAEAIAEPTSPFGELHHGSGSVLVLDGEPLLRHLSRQILEMVGYEVLEARVPQDAVQICTRRPPGSVHLLLTDAASAGDAEVRRALETALVVQPGLRFLALERPFTPSELTRRVHEELGNAGA